MEIRVKKFIIINFLEFIEVALILNRHLRLFKLNHVFEPA